MQRQATAKSGPCNLREELHTIIICEQANQFSPVLFPDRPMLFPQAANIAHNFAAKKPLAILALDIDDTLIDVKASFATGQLVFFNQAAIINLLKKALLANIMPILLTARDDRDALDVSLRQCAQSYFLAPNICRQLDNLIAYVCYTNAKRTNTMKSHVLNHLGTIWSLGRHQILLVDDSEEQLTLCRRHKFSVVDAKDKDHLNEIEIFIDIQKLHLTLGRSRNGLFQPKISAGSVTSMADRSHNQQENKSPVAAECRIC